MCMAQQTLSSTSWMVDAPWSVSWLTGTTARAPPSRVPKDPVAALGGLEPDFPIHSGEGRTGITPGFPFTKAW
ncbi:hypothetical protein AQJ67_03890 [Streptomyces caeruleatus]|uniref:Uncharacterized protein n=1 Tax=Streptomyces caeruleatus TaxID=661399 RepID=A0A101U8T0_9ACTN|nr:hypothetical protein AQJ67_03890 [Streptomyces caeruleatus]